MAPGVDSGDTAWMLAATALVLMMTPALGLFYAGLVRSKNTLNTFMLLRLIGVFAPLPVSERDDGLGLDVTRHGEEAYAHGDGMVLLSPEAGLELERPLAQP